MQEAALVAVLWPFCSGLAGFSLPAFSISSDVIELRMSSADSPRLRRFATAMLASTISAEDTTAAVPMNF